MIASTLKRIGFGFILGMSIGNLISAFAGGNNIVTPVLTEHVGSFLAAYLLQTLLSGILGAVSFGGMSFYEIEHWSLLRTAVTHFALIMAVYIPISLFLGWIDSSEVMLIMFFIMAIAYLIIFIIMWMIYSAEVKKLNEMQQHILDNN